MKVLDLRCAQGHGFEGWFASEDDYRSQNDRSLIECPMCADKSVSRLPSAPRLNLSGAKEIQPKPESAPDVQAKAASQVASRPLPADAPAELQAAWFAAVKHLVSSTEDVGPRFAEEARRIHYGEKPQRGIRGQATPQEREALQEEGIETLSIPVPRGLDGPLQ